jgi:hypothetical protein
MQKAIGKSSLIRTQGTLAHRFILFLRQIEEDEVSCWD